MIEKLKTINPYDETEIDMGTNSVAGLVYENTPLVQKINELVEFCNDIGNARSFLERHEGQITKLNDSVNELHSAKDVMFNRIDRLNDAICDIRNHIADTSKKVDDRMIGCTTLDIPKSYKTDPYVEQRWVGHLCKLWTGDGLVRYGILRGVALNRKKTKYPYQALSTSFEHCEPVKPDSDIIYKGE